MGFGAVARVECVCVFSRLEYGEITDEEGIFFFLCVLMKNEVKRAKMTRGGVGDHLRSFFFFPSSPTHIHISTSPFLSLSYTLSGSTFDFERKLTYI